MKADCWIPLTKRYCGRNREYTQMCVLGEQIYTHRLSYEIFVGRIPTGLTIDHLCEQKNCINPKHLKPATQRENILRSTKSASAINARKTHCKRNHKFSKLNSAGRRICQLCYKLDATLQNRIYYRSNCERIKARRRIQYRQRKKENTLCQ